MVTHLALEIAHATPDGAALEWTWEAQAEPPTPEESLALYERIADAAFAACHAEGGIIAHHFGIGAARRKAFAHERGPAAMSALNAIKTALDPNRILNSFS
jgi:FAD/FMN-containing dehydrogenase